VIWGREPGDVDGTLDVADDSRRLGSASWQSRRPVDDEEGKEMALRLRQASGGFLRARDCSWRRGI